MILTVICSWCEASLDLDVQLGTAMVGNLIADLYDDGDLLTWDCPSCDYADSYWPTFDSDQWKEYRDGR